MADIFQLLGSYATSPTSGVPSGSVGVEAAVDERVALQKKASADYELAADAPEAVDFCGLSAANVLVVKTIGGKVRIRVTSADGATQAFPVDSFLVLMSAAVPITAVDLTRVSGVSTTVRVFLGQSA